MFANVVALSKKIANGQITRNAEFAGNDGQNDANAYVPIYPEFDLELGLRSYLWVPSDVEWIDAKSIQFGMSSLNERKGGKEKKGALLRHSPAGWSLELPAN